MGNKRRIKFSNRRVARQKKIYNSMNKNIEQKNRREVWDTRCFCDELVTLIDAWREVVCRFRSKFLCIWKRFWADGERIFFYQYVRYHSHTVIRIIAWAFNFNYKTAFSSWVIYSIGSENISKLLPFKMTILHLFRLVISC